MKVLVYGALPEQANLGVVALAEGSKSVLERAFPGVDVRFRSAGAAGDGPINLTHTTPLLREMATNRLGLRAWAKSFDLVCDIRGGDSFTDIYGLKSLFKLSVFPLYATALRVPVALLPQTIGPFEHRRARVLAKTYLRRAALVMTRDPRSAAYARDTLGEEVDLSATDVVFAIPHPTDVTDGEHDVVLNVSGLLWAENRHVDAATYRQVTFDLIDALLQHGRRVTVLAHVVGATSSGPDNDRTALEDVRTAYGDRLAYCVPAGLSEVRRVIASSNVLIGARMHACLNALSVGVPAIPLAYSRKFAPLLDDLGWHQTVDLRGAADDIASAVLARVDQVRKEDVAPVREEAGRRVEQVVTTLQNWHGSHR